MMNKMIIRVIFLLLLSGAVLISLYIKSRPPILEELEMVKEKATHVEVVNRDCCFYDIFHKRAGASFLSELFASIEFEKREKKMRRTAFAGSEQYFNFVFYNKDERISLMQLTPCGQIRTRNGRRECLTLTSESQVKLNSLISKLGYTDDLGSLPLAANVSASTNAVFRKESSVPYVLNNTVFVMPYENFSVGVIVNNFNRGGFVYVPDNYNIYYLDDQSYDNDTLNIAFRVSKGSQKEIQAHIDIINNCSFAVAFHSMAVKDNDFLRVSLEHCIEPNKTLSIEADPSVDCYILVGIMDKPEEEWW